MRGMSKDALPLEGRGFLLPRIREMMKTAHAKNNVEEDE
jgi:hypothetical protein